MSFFDVLVWLGMCVYASSVANSVNHFITCVWPISCLWFLNCYSSPSGILYKVEKIILSRCHSCQPVHELILVTKPGVHMYQAQVAMATKF